MCEAPRGHTEWGRCPPTTELRGSPQISASPGRPAHTEEIHGLNRRHLLQSAVVGRCVWGELTEEMKLDAVVVTVALAEEEQCRRALEKNVHMMALQANRRAPHSSRRGMWSWGHSGDESTPRLIWRQSGSVGLTRFSGFYPDYVFHLSLVMIWGYSMWHKQTKNYFLARTVAKAEEQLMYIWESHQWSHQWLLHSDVLVTLQVEISTWL